MMGFLGDIAPLHEVPCPSPPWTTQWGFRLVGWWGEGPGELWCMKALGRQAGDWIPFFFFKQLHLQHMEVPRPGVE